MKSKKLLATVGASALAVTMLIGAGTFAYLNDTSDIKVNEFSPNKVTVDLEETTSDYEIIPGTTQDKDPTATITNTVDAYLFVEITDETDGLVDWEIADGWTALDGYENVYYREVAADADTKEFAVLKDNQVSYDSSITNEDMIDDATLSFVAKAIQKAGFDSAAAAYAQTPVSATTDDDITTALAAGQSVKLQNDIEDGTGLKAASGDDVVIDLNGYTLDVENAVGSSGTETLATQFLKGSTVTLKDGDLTFGDSVKMVIQNYGNTTIDSVDMDCSDNSNVLYVISNNYGKTTITGDCQIIAPSGSVAVDVMDWTNSAYYDDGSVVEFDENFTGLVDGKIDVYQYPVDADAGTTAELIIKGGTFQNTGLTLEQFSAYVPDGYEVTETSDGVYVVTAE